MRTLIVQRDEWTGKTSICNDKMILIICILLVFSSLFAQYDSEIQEFDKWTAGNLSSAYITAIEVHPKDSLTIFAGTYDRGLFFTKDGGNNWKSADGVRDTTKDERGIYASIRKIGFDPQHPDTMYFITWGDGMYKSLDGGESWTAIGRGILDKYRTTDFAIHPDTSQIIFVTVWSSLSSGGMYKSENGGLSWDGIFTQTDCHLIKFHPNSPDTMYCGLGQSGLYRSTNGGTDWEHQSEFNWITFHKLIIDPKKPMRMYAYVETGYMEHLLAKSTDGGVKWLLKYNDIPFLDGSLIVDFSSEYPIIYAKDNSDNKLKRGKDTGEEIIWHVIAESVFDPGQAMAISSNNPEIIYIAGADGPWKSPNRGSLCWPIHGSGLQASHITSIKAQSVSGKLLVGTGKEGFWASNDIGSTWDAFNDLYFISEINDIEITDVEIFIITNRNLYTNSYNNQYRRIGAGGFCVAVNPLNTNTVYSGYGSLNKTEDKGGSWKNITGFGLINDISISPHDTSTILIAGREGLYVTHDAGETFSHYLEGIYCTTVEMHPSIFGNFCVGTKEMGLYKGRNFGKVMMPDTLGLGYPVIEDIIYNPENPDILYAATKRGLYRQYVKDSLWIKLSEPAEKTDHITALEILPGNPQVLYAGTYNGGLYTMLIEDAEAQNMRDEFGAFPEQFCNIYPNPFNSKIVFEFVTPVPTQAELYIYDISGRIVNKAIINTISGDKNRIEWNTTISQNGNISSGIYLFTLKTKFAVNSGKICYIK